MIQFFRRIKAELLDRDDRIRELQYIISEVVAESDETVKMQSKIEKVDRAGAIEATKVTLSNCPRKKTALVRL